MTDKNIPLDPSLLAQLANAKSQGSRPDYFSDPMNEQHYAMTMALMAELAVARERIDTLERVLEDNGLLKRSQVEEFVPDEQAATERQTAQIEYSARIFRALQQQVESMQQKELSVEEMAKRLGETQNAGGDTE